VARTCRAGTGCGGCHAAIECVIAEEHSRESVELLSLADYAPAS
jgi:hypothetical protein